MKKAILLSLFCCFKILLLSKHFLTLRLFYHDFPRKQRPFYNHTVTVQPAPAHQADLLLKQFSPRTRQTMLLNDTLSLRERRNGTRLENTSPRTDVFQGSYEEQVCMLL